MDFYIFVRVVGVFLGEEVGEVTEEEDYRVVRGWYLSDSVGFFLEIGRRRVNVG